MDACYDMTYFDCLPISLCYKLVGATSSENFLVTTNIGWIPTRLTVVFCGKLAPLYPLTDSLLNETACVASQHLRRDDVRKTHSRL